VDLAGSETLSADLGAAQQKETKAINLSLTQLKTVITCLSKSERYNNCVIAPVVPDASPPDA